MGEEHQRAEDAGRIDGWIAAFRGPLVGLLASWGTDWAAAEELAQDTFAEAWLSRARFRGNFDDHGALGAWLRGIAFHLHSTAHRAAERRRALRLEDHDAARDDAPPDERHADLALAFRRLRTPHQTVLRMHYLEETSARDVAALLGLSTKAVEGRLYQARIALRAELDRVNARQQQEVR